MGLKIFLFYICVIFSGWGIPWSSAQIEGLIPIEVEDVPVEVYVPKGFDANDLTEIWVEGYFESQCEKYRPLTREDIDLSQLDRGKIVIHNKNYLYQGFLCTPHLQRYQKRIEIGALGLDGEFTLAFMNERQEEKNKPDWSLPVAPVDPKYLEPEHPFGPDADFYAPVKSFDFELLEDRSTAQIVIHGDFSDPRMKIKTIETRVHEKVIEVVPYLEHFDMDSEVQKQAYSEPFKSKPIQVEDVPNRRVLVHVRSLGGKSASSIFDLSKTPRIEAKQEDRK